MVFSNLSTVTLVKRDCSGLRFEFSSSLLLYTQSKHQSPTQPENWSGSQSISGGYSNKILHCRAGAELKCCWEDSWKAETSTPFYQSSYPVEAILVFQEEVATNAYDVKDI